ncbi:putative nose resistant to fluoxetine protein 6-like [Penaeus vannamei]|uniref:Putative nose resistant to fluoxetine protein 6-like n=1 Tax=Penaeus vannamei TaxID=6689 RepID=A0A3R7QV73_PENVA|nr:putative nose resistant to fluoxetine protein 6-like [Penaeus vannamei]
MLWIIVSVQYEVATDYITNTVDALRCLDHCWYTAVDMQLLLILPLLLLPLGLHRVAGLCWLGAVSLGSILTPMSIILVHDLPPVPLHVMSESKKFEYMWRVYLTPWCRAGPWLAGVWTALALYDRALAKVKIPKLAVFLGYLAAISLGLGLVLGLYPYNHVMPDKSYVDNPAMSAAYGALARPVWGLCVAWVVFTCHTGNAGVVNKVLSYPGWRPLGRLTFTMYLTVPLVQLWWSSVQFQPVYYNYLEKLFQSAGVAFIAGVVAILLSCLVELPLRTPSLLLILTPPYPSPLPHLIPLPLPHLLPSPSLSPTYLLPLPLPPPPTYSPPSPHLLLPLPPPPSSFYSPSPLPFWISPFVIART